MKRWLAAWVVVTFLLSGAIASLGLCLFATPAAAKMEFDRYELIILRSVPGAKELSKEESAAMMEGHFGHFKKMAAAGKLKVCGPFDDQDDKTARGLCLYQVGSVAEAKKLAEEDPAVKAGHLRVEAMTWYCQKGVVAFPPLDKP